MPKAQLYRNGCEKTCATNRRRPISRTYDRQWWKKKKYSTLLSKKYHRSATVCTSSNGTSPLGCSHESPLSQQPVPRSTWWYQDICVHMVYVWVVLCTLHAIQYATLPSLTTAERHVVKYNVWVFPVHLSLCAVPVLSNLMAAVLSSLMTAALPNVRYHIMQCCQLSCLGCLCRSKTESFSGEDFVSTFY